MTHWPREQTLRLSPLLAATELNGRGLHYTTALPNLSFGAAGSQDMAGSSQGAHRRRARQHLACKGGREGTRPYAFWNACAVPSIELTPTRLADCTIWTRQDTPMCCANVGAKKGCWQWTQVAYTRGASIDNFSDCPSSAANQSISCGTSYNAPSYRRWKSLEVVARGWRSLPQQLQRTTPVQSTAPEQIA